jgi:ABC-type glycerol-3-phosphate transport system substrate-binding protein
MLTIKKVLAILLACLMLLGVMGCMANQSTDATTTETQDAATEEPAATEEESSGEEAASAPSGTVEFWTLYSPGTIQSELYDEIVADFNASHPDITVNISYVGQDIVTQIRPTIINGNPPDLFVCNTGIGSTLAEEGVLMTLNDYLADSDYSGEQVWSDTFIDGSLEAGVMTGDDIQMIPFELGITCWFYNKGLFDELGLTEPTTWDEMVAIFEKISEAGVAPIGADGNVDFYLSWYYSNLAIRLAGHDKYVSAISGETSWTEPEFLEAAQKLQEMLPYFQKGFEGTQYPGANALFVQGQAAMMYVGSWLPQEILSIMPEGFELGMFEWPNFNADDPKMVEVKCNGLCIPTNAANPDAAIEFAKYYTSKEVAEKISTTLDTHTATAGCVQPEVIADIEEIVSTADVVTPQYNYLYNAEYSDYSGTVLFPLISQFMLGQIKTPEEFIDLVEQGTKDYYSAS